jgi:hypothetical protein
MIYAAARAKALAAAGVGTGERVKIEDRSPAIFHPPSSILSRFSVLGSRRPICDYA